MKRPRRRAVRVARWMVPRQTEGSRGECRCWVELEETFRTIIDWNRFPCTNSIIHYMPKPKQRQTPNLAFMTAAPTQELRCISPPVQS